MLVFAFDIKATTLGLSFVTDIMLIKAECETVIFSDPIHGS